MLKSGEKTIELRLFDAKRKMLKVGDVIEFINCDDIKDTFSAKITELFRAGDFEELNRKINCKEAGFASGNELVNTMLEFYSIEKQKEFGVVGIKIAKIHTKTR